MLVFKNIKICVTPNANPQRQPMEYSSHWVGPYIGHVHFILFVSISCVLGSHFPVEYWLKAYHLGFSFFMIDNRNF